MPVPMPAAEPGSKSCPICLAEAEATVWPYLKGGTDWDGQPLQWMRCSRCNALFSNLTLPGEVRRSYPVAGEPHCLSAPYLESEPKAVSAPSGRSEPPAKESTERIERATRD
jgi:hypothetical protein